MPACQTSTAVLSNVVELLDRALDAASSSRVAALVRIDRLPEDGEDEVQFSLKRLPPGVHPLAVLDGFVAPPTWAGIGVVAHGEARPFDGAERRAGRARVICLVTRAGALASGLRLDDGELLVRVEPPGTGVVGDIPFALCRALGVPLRGPSAGSEGDRE